MFANWKRGLICSLYISLKDEQSGEMFLHIIYGHNNCWNVIEQPATHIPQRAWKDRRCWNSDGCQTKIEMDEAIYTVAGVHSWDLDACQNFNLHRLQKGTWRSDEKGHRALTASASLSAQSSNHKLHITCKS